MKYKRIIQVVVTLAIMAFFCNMVYNTFKDIDKVVLKKVFKQGLELWPCYLIVLFVYLIALMVRAHRWALMLGEPKKLFWLSFRSVALSYGAQLVLTKGGEFVRIYNQKQGSDRSLGELMATVFIDRMLDFIALLCILFFAFFYGGEKIETEFPEFAKLFPFISSIILFGLVLILILIFFGEKVSKSLHASKKINEKLAKLLSNFIDRFVMGLSSIRSPMQFLYLFVSTFLIWLCYFLMMYFSVAFYPQVDDRYAFGPFIFVFTCSVLGTLVPVPGSLGPYHVFTTKGLAVMFGYLGKDVIFGIVTMAFIVCLWMASALYAIICLLYQFFSKASVKSQAETT